MIKLKGAEELNGFMDQGTQFNGELRFRHTFRIDGQLQGRIVSDNTLVVGETGEVEADIDCGVVSISGSVKGLVRGRERIELHTGARVEATLVSPRLIIEEGALFQGDCDMDPSAKQAKAAAGDGGTG